jgi:uncharacterized protein YwgA
MNKLQSIVAYFCSKYPHKSELSNARLTKLVYLADWFSSLVDGKPMTNINWVFNHYGPYVDDVVDSVRGTQGFSIECEQNAYGASKNVISFIGNEEDIDLSQREEKILDVVIEKTKHLYFNDFIDYVYSTYPVKSQERYSALNLEALAKQYKQKSISSTTAQSL